MKEKLKNVCKTFLPFLQLDEWNPLSPSLVGKTHYCQVWWEKAIIAKFDEGKPIIVKFGGRNPCRQVRWEKPIIAKFDAGNLLSPSLSRVTSFQERFCFWLYLILCMETYLFWSSLALREVDGTVHFLANVVSFFA